MRILRLVFPAVFCAILIYTTKMSIVYYPLAFGFIIGLINWEVHKFNPIFGVFLSITASYLSFVIAYFSIGLIGEMIGFIIHTGNEEFSVKLAFLISPFIIAPLLVFFSYKYLFNFPKSKKTVLIIIVAIILLLLNGIIALYYEFGYPYFMWQIIMALAIQLLIYPFGQITKPGKLH